MSNSDKCGTPDASIDGQAMNGKAWLTPAECASRTGLTVRALRVYERYGLVVAKRLANGWRRYGSEEMERLNTITVLKAVGMTLAQIRKLIDAKNPSLAQVLEIQIDAWQAKKIDAERGQALAKVAQRRLLANQSVSVDELCRLIRGFEMSDQLTRTRELLDDQVTPEEIAAFRARVASDPSRAADFKANLTGQTNIFGQLRVLMEAGASAGSPEVQKVLDERATLMTRHKVFEHMADMIEWNRPLALKIYSLDAKLLKKLRNSPIPHGGDSVFTPALVDFYIAAVKESEYWKRSRDLFKDADQVMSVSIDPSSLEAQKLAAKFSAMHIEFNFGDPKVYARIMPYTALLNGGWPDWMGGHEVEPIWNFLTSAINCGTFKAGQVDQQ